MSNKNLSLLAVSTTLATGGAQRFLSTLLTHLDRTLFAPRLVLLRNQIEYPLPADVPIHHLGYGGLATFWPAALRLRRLIAEHRPDVILSNVNATNLLAGCALPGGADGPRWIARVGNNMACGDSWIRQVVARRVYGKADRIVANSPGLVNEVAARFPQVRDRVQLIENPTDFSYIDEQSRGSAETQRPSDGRKVFIAVGRLSRQKRYDLMLDVFASVRRRCPATLWICGEGAERSRLERRINQLELTEDVTLLGFCSNPYALMAQADLFLLTSDYEGSPNALIEAQGLGLPAISTRCPHGPDAIVDDGKTGFLADVGDVPSIVNAVEKFLAKPRNLLSREEIRKQTRERFAAAKLTRKWEEALATPSGKLRDERAGSVDGEGVVSKPA